MSCATAAHMPLMWINPFWWFSYHFFIVSHFNRFYFCIVVHSKHFSGQWILYFFAAILQVATRKPVSSSYMSMQHGHICSTVCTRFIVLTEAQNQRKDFSDRMTNGVDTRLGRSHHRTLWHQKGTVQLTLSESVWRRIRRPDISPQVELWSEDIGK